MHAKKIYNNLEAIKEILNEYSGIPRNLFNEIYDHIESNSNWYDDTTKHSPIIKRKNLFGKFKILELIFDFRKVKIGRYNSKIYTGTAMASLLTAAAELFIECVIDYYTHKSSFIVIFQSKVKTDMFGNQDYYIVIQEFGKFIEKTKYGSKTLAEYPKRSDFAEKRLILAEIMLEYAILDRFEYSKEIHVDKGRLFEKQCAEEFKRIGFDVWDTPATGDFGADLLMKFGKHTYVVQCKDSVKSVGIKAIQEVFSAKLYYKTDFAIVVASGDFTSSAIELAIKDKEVFLRARPETL